jgi:hypothetical protein
MQRYTVYLCLETALHVSGGTSIHHQKRIQLYLQHLVSGIYSIARILFTIYLGFYTGTEGCGCSSKVLLMMGKMLAETC